MELLIDKFLNSFRGRLKPSTLSDYRSILTLHFLRFGSIDLANNGAFEDYLSALPVTGKRKNNILSAVNSFVAWAQRRNEWEGEWMPIPRFPATSNKIEPLRPDEAKLIVSRSLWPYRDWFAVAIHTGMRTGELFALKFADFDLKNGLIRVERAFSRGELGSTKTGLSRDVPLSKEVQHIYHRRKRDNQASSEWFFYSASARGGIMSYSAVRKAWIRQLKLFGIRQRPLYATRHTFASIAIAAGEDPLWVAQVLGHGRPDQLFLRYASHLAGLKRDGQKLEDLLREYVQPYLRVVK